MKSAITLPAVLVNGVGAAQDASLMAPRKSIVVTGNWLGTVTVEVSCDAGGDRWQSVASFSAPGKTNVTVAARWLRVRTTGIKRASAIDVEVGGNDAELEFGALDIPAGNGVGNALDVSDFGAYNTFIVTGRFTGTLNVQVSQDGTSWMDCLTATKPGAYPRKVFGQWFRVRRSGVKRDAPGAPVVDVGAGVISGGGGGGGGNTLDEAYNEGGAGAGRLITVGAGGPVEIQQESFDGVELPPMFKIEGNLQTDIDSTESPDIDIDLSREVTFASFSLSTQRAIRITPPTYVRGGGFGTLQDAATVAILGAPAGNNINRSYALLAQGWTRVLGELSVGGGVLSSSFATIESSNGDCRIQLGSAFVQVARFTISGTFDLRSLYPRNGEQDDIGNPTSGGQMRAWRDTFFQGRSHRLIEEIDTEIFTASLSGRHNVVVCNRDGNQTVNLQAGSQASTRGRVITFEKTGSGTLTIQRQSSETIYHPAGNVTSITISAGESVTLHKATSLVWYPLAWAFVDPRRVLPLAIDTGEIDYNVTHGFTFEAELDAAAEVQVPSGLRKGMKWDMVFTQDATGGRALTFVAAYDFGDQGSPDTSAAAAGESIMISCYAKTDSVIFARFADGFTS